MTVDRRCEQLDSMIAYASCIKTEPQWGSCKSGEEIFDSNSDSFVVVTSEFSSNSCIPANKQMNEINYPFHWWHKQLWLKSTPFRDSKDWENAAILVAISKMTSIPGLVERFHCMVDRSPFSKPRGFHPSWYNSVVQTETLLVHPMDTKTGPTKQNLVNVMLLTLYSILDEHRTKMRF